MQKNHSFRNAGWKVIVVVRNADTIYLQMCSKFGHNKCISSPMAVVSRDRYECIHLKHTNAQSRAQDVHDPCSNLREAEECVSHSIFYSAMRAAAKRKSARIVTVEIHSARQYRQGHHRELPGHFSVTSTAQVYLKTPNGQFLFILTHLHSKFFWKILSAIIMLLEIT